MLHDKIENSEPGYRYRQTMTITLQTHTFELDHISGSKEPDGRIKYS